MFRVLGLAAFAMLVAWLSSSAPAVAQDWPTRTVRIIIPLGAGGGGDVFSRLLAEELQKRFGQPFVVENRPGGGLNIGARACAEVAARRLHHLRDVERAGGLQPVPVQILPFNPEKDFEPITNLFVNSVALVANSSLKSRPFPNWWRLPKPSPAR